MSLSTLRFLRKDFLQQITGFSKALQRAFLEQELRRGGLVTAGTGSEMQQRRVEHGRSLLRLHRLDEQLKALWQVPLPAQAIKIQVAQVALGAGVTQRRRPGEIVPRLVEVRGHAVTVLVKPGEVVPGGRIAQALRLRKKLPRLLVVALHLEAFVCNATQQVVGVVRTHLGRLAQRFQAQTEVIVKSFGKDIQPPEVVSGFHASTPGGAAIVAKRFLLIKFRAQSQLLHVAAIGYGNDITALGSLAEFLKGQIEVSHAAEAVLVTDTKVVQGIETADLGGFRVAVEGHLGIYIDAVA